jgi:hypothetical protein
MGHIEMGCVIGAGSQHIETAAAAIGVDDRDGTPPVGHPSSIGEEKENITEARRRVA